MTKNRLMLGLILGLGVLLCVLLVFAGTMDAPQNPTNTTDILASQPTDTQPTIPTVTQPTTVPTVPTEPPIVKTSTATIGATGDILFHDLVIASGYVKETDSFDYNYIFSHFSEYVKKTDYAIANLEVNLIHRPGSKGFKGYNGYPLFNSPDELADALKETGFNMLLTANNHSYDNSHDGFHRTQQVVADRGMAYIGTRLTEQDKNYSVQDVNGIKIGMINYTYNTSQDTNGKISLNGIQLTAEDSKLVNSFNYYQLDSFYEKLQGELDAMRDEGAEAIVIYIHWGDEYKTIQNSYQDKISQQLCNMGIDVIVGNHAHVPQPVELLQNENDDTKKTLCLYSTGNAISNIYRGNFPINTEDGMLFSFTFAKYSDGTVVLEGAEVLPTWVYRYYDANWTRKFKILTLDDQIEDWKTALSIDDATEKECRDSYTRTMEIVGAGLEEANAYYSQNQAEVEALLGVVTE